MPAWILKAMIQKGISFLPGGSHINTLFQKYITKGLQLTDELFESKLKHCQAHAEALNQYTSFTENITALELGTGWYPIVPIGLYLQGAGNIISLDIKSTVTKKTIHAVLKKFLAYNEIGKLHTLLKGIRNDRLEIVKDLAKKRNNKAYILEKMQIKLFVGDYLMCDVPDGSVHLINSNNTFEHVPPQVLSDLLHWFRKKIHPGGVMSHFIDLSDHFSHMDTSISNYHFLKYSPLQWKIIDNTIQPQNRLRINQYRQLLEEANWHLLFENCIVAQPGRTNEIKLHNCFANIPAADLYVTHALLYCKPA